MIFYTKLKMLSFSDQLIDVAERINKPNDVHVSFQFDI